MAEASPSRESSHDRKLPKLAWSTLSELLIELMIGAILAIGAAGFSYAFVKRAFLSESRELIDEDFADATHAAMLPPPELGSQSAQARSNVIYPVPDSHVIGQGETAGSVDTLVGWGFPADGLLEIREDVPDSRAHFYPLHKQEIEHARLRAGRRYIWRVFTETDELRQKIIAGPYRFTLHGRP